MYRFIVIAVLSLLMGSGCALSRSAATKASGAVIGSRAGKSRLMQKARLEPVGAPSQSSEDSEVENEQASTKSVDEQYGERTSSIEQVVYSEADTEHPGQPSVYDVVPASEGPSGGVSSAAGSLGSDGGSLELRSEAETPVSRNRAYSLTELTAITEQEHPRLRMAAAEIESVMGERVQAGLYPNPRMETNNPEIWAGRDSQVNFGWQQDFITKGKMRLDKAAADQKVRVTEATYVVEKMRVLTLVRIQYVQALAARERLRNSEEILEISKTARDVAAELMETGERTLTDVLLLKNSYERARLAVENNRTRLDAELRQVAIATGVPDLVVTDVVGSIDDHPPYYDEPYIREFLQSNSASMIMARAEVVRRKIMLNRAEVEPYPDFRFGPHYAAGTADGSSRQFWFTFVFDIPIWNLNQGNIRSAQAEVLSAQAQVENRRMELLNDLAEIHSRHKTSQLFLARVESSILPNAEQTQKLVQEGYAEGTLDVNRLLESQRALLEAKQDQIDAYEQSWRTAAELAGYLQFEQFP